MLARAPIAPSFDDLVAARNSKARQQCIEAARRVAHGQMPQCKWIGRHRHQVVKERAGHVVEFCMDCGGAGRTYPGGKTSKDAKPYTGAI